MENQPLISYLITVCNEYVELKRLFTQLVEKARNFEIVVLVDSSNTTSEVISFLNDQQQISHPFPLTILHKGLDGNFAEFKNYGNTHCKGKWICQVDADEFFLDSLLDRLPGIIQANDAFVDFIYIPRVNTVAGITLEHIQQWKWRVSSLEGMTRKDVKTILTKKDLELLRHFNLIVRENDLEVEYLIPIINFPDYQTRLYRSVPEIKWQGRVHEIITGSTRYGLLPSEEAYSLFHFKTIYRQEQQNNFYSTL